MDPMYPRSKPVAVVSQNDGNPIDTMIAQNAQIIALLTDIRDDQRAVQDDDGKLGNGKVGKVKTITGGLL